MRSNQVSRRTWTRRWRIRGAFIKSPSGTSRGTHPKPSHRFAASNLRNSSMWPKCSAPTAGASARRRSRIRSHGRSTRSACRSFALRRSSNYCSATSAAREAVSLRFGVIPRFKALPTSRRCSTSFRDTFRCPMRRRIATSNISSNRKARAPVSGAIWISTSSVCSRRGSARTQASKTIIASTCCRASAEITQRIAAQWGWSTGKSKASSASVKTRLSAARIPACTGAL